MRRNILTLTFCLMGLPLVTLAQDRQVVVELYTSQGCSSCPPADALLAELSGNPDVLALAFHVDYWDYLGWRDDLGSPDHTKRQKAYANAAGERMVYTPQAIVNGAERMVGSDQPALMSAIMRAAKAHSLVDLSLTRQGEVLNISANAKSDLGSIDVILVRYVPETIVHILRGENAGRSVTYVNTVTHLSVVTIWPGKAPLDVAARLDGQEAAAVLLQRSGMGEVIAAASLP